MSKYIFKKIPDCHSLQTMSDTTKVVVSTETCVYDDLLLEFHYFLLACGYESALPQMLDDNFEVWEKISVLKEYIEEHADKGCEEAEKILLEMFPNDYD